ncbi:MAG TPA: hypothetical protein PLH19_09255 [Anaerolineae bacterium]|nr:hypothetical protein [Anaerolineae bacterium]HQH38704.1 hypothetical protein [Anaerolineae bacterium]
MRQFNLTPVMGKRLIGKGMAQHPDIQRVLQKGTLLIVAGTTNGYVAEEILTLLGQAKGFSRVGFRRGVTVAPGAKLPQAELAGDVVIVDGQWQPGKTVFDVAESLKAGDVVLKGGNAFDPYGQAAVQVGHPQGGTVMAIVPTVIGRRVQLIVPIGLEKRVLDDIYTLAQRVNAPDAEGPRLMPLPGEVFTELDAIQLLTGAEPFLIAGGGIFGAEGSAWIGVSGTAEQVEAAAELLHSVAGEPPCEV